MLKLSCNQYSTPKEMKTPEFRRERHSVTDLKIHLICITKYRQKVFTNEGLRCIESAMRSVSDSMHFRILEFNGEADHIHVLLEFPQSSASLPWQSILKVSLAAHIAKQGIQSLQKRRFGALRILLLLWVALR